MPLWILKHWRVAGVLILLLTTIWQTWQVDSLKGEIKLTEAQHRAEAADHRATQAELRAMRARVAAATTQTLMETKDEEAPVIDRVVVRTRNVCVRGADEAGVLPPAGSALLDDGRGGRDADDPGGPRADQRWLDKVSADLRMCHKELLEARASAEYLKGIGAVPIGGPDE